MTAEIKRTVVEMQSLGVRMPDTRGSRKGGAGPAEGQTIQFAHRFISVPTQSSYVRSSPYEIRTCGDDFVLCKNENIIGAVSLPPRPRYYDFKTRQGISFEKIALIHGKDCFASTVYQDCSCWNGVGGCIFCGIGVSLKNNKTLLLKDPEDVGMAAERARALDNVSHATLTTGMNRNEQDTALHIAQCTAAIKKGADLPVHVQICPPHRLTIMDMLREAGADTIGIHIETFDPDTIKQAAPSKADYGIEQFVKTWEYAVALFGKNQVSSFIIAGLGEDPSSIISGAEMLCTIGVYPYLLPFRPIVSTPLEHKTPPQPDMMFSLYEKTGKLLKKYGLSSPGSKAGCVRCGACSAISLFEEISQ